MNLQSTLGFSGSRIKVYIVGCRFVLKRQEVQGVKSRAVVLRPMERALRMTSGVHSNENGSSIRHTCMLCVIS